MRIDLLLWYLRLAKSRSAAQAMAEAGHIRRNGRRVDRAHQRVDAGDIIVLPAHGRVLSIALLTLPERRGPASEAQSCYRVLDAAADLALAAPHCNQADKGDLQP